MASKQPQKVEKPKAVPKPPEKIEQPHGGALLSGGQPGNKGGGRPPSGLRLRGRMLGSLDDRLKIAEHILDNPDSDDGNKLRALDFLAKYSIGQVREVAVDNVRERVERTLETIQELVSPEQNLILVRALQKVWTE